MIDVKIEKLKLENADKIAEWKSDRELSKLILSNFSHTSISEAQKWIKKNSEDKNQRLFGIYYKEQIIGVSRLMFIDFEAGVCEFGFYIGNYSYRGLGLGRKSLQLTLDYAFNELNLQKVFLKVRSNNKPAFNLYKRIGFEVEGYLKDHYFNGDNFEDIVFMSFFLNTNY